jgi:hypothetical protein
MKMKMKKEGQREREGPSMTTPFSQAPSPLPKEKGSAPAIYATQGRHRVVAAGAAAVMKGQV